MICAPPTVRGGGHLLAPPHAVWLWDPPGPPGLLGCLCPQRHTRGCQVTATTDQARVFEVCSREAPALSCSYTHFAGLFTARSAPRVSSEEEQLDRRLLRGSRTELSRKLDPPLLEIPVLYVIKDE